jgi:hypothetical protein
VRHFQLAALRNARTADSAVEIIRVLDEMRRNDEPLTKSQRSDLESHVYFGYKREVLEQLLSILPPSSHLATYQWLVRGFESRDLRDDFWVARLTEAAGDPKSALSLYRAIRLQSQTQGFTMGRELEEAIRRCEAAVRTLR